MTGPVVEAERWVALDALRGLAIAGVLVANVFTFAYPMLAPTPQTAALRGAGVTNRAIQLAVGLLVEGKFYAMLSVLFGMGLMMQSHRVAERGGRFGRLYARRLLVLFCSCIAHAVLLYSADILSFYALVGLAATTFRGLSRRRLLGVAIVVFLIGLFVAEVGVDSSWPPNWERVANGEAALRCLLRAMPPPSHNHPRVTQMHWWCGAGRAWPPCTDELPPAIRCLRAALL